LAEYYPNAEENPAVSRVFFRQTVIFRDPPRSAAIRRDPPRSAAILAVSGGKRPRAGHGGGRRGLILA
jgi:hypothetical protein